MFASSPDGALTSVGSPFIESKIHTKTVSDQERILHLWRSRLLWISSLITEQRGSQEAEIAAHQVIRQQFPLLWHALADSQKPYCGSLNDQCAASAQRVKVHLQQRVNRSERCCGIKVKKNVRLFTHLARRSICNANGCVGNVVVPSRSLQTAGCWKALKKHYTTFNCFTNVCCCRMTELINVPFPCFCSWNDELHFICALK